ncbi:MAG: hypothetical protein ACRDRH_22130 [Pseudonocardia sp.]
MLRTAPAGQLRRPSSRRRHRADPEQVGVAADQHDCGDCDGGTTGHITHVFDRYVLIALALLGSLITGVLLGMKTKWGLV